jgi:hypothetical protein
MKICPLCNINEVVGIESHIFPKFLGKTLKDNKGKNQLFLFSGEDIKKRIPKQDTAKQDFLLCFACEKMLNEKYENKFAETFYNIRYDNNHYNRFQSEKGLSYRQYKKLDYRTFKLFFYSMLYRASIATIQPYKDFKISPEFEKLLAGQLLETSEFDDIPLYVFLLTDEKYDHKKNINWIGSFLGNKSTIQMIANDLMIVFDDKDDDPNLKCFYSLCSINGFINICEISARVWEKWIESAIIQKSRSVG